MTLKSPASTSGATAAAAFTPSGEVLATREDVEAAFLEQQRRKGKKLGELRAITSSYDQTEFVMKTGWATFPGQADPNRAVAEACAAGLLKTAAAK